MISIISIIVILLVVGLLLWALNSLPMIDGNMKQIAYVLIVVLAVLWLLQSLGLLGGTRIGI